VPRCQSFVIFLIPICAPRHKQLHHRISSVHRSNVQRCMPVVAPRPHVKTPVDLHGDKASVNARSCVRRRDTDAVGTATHTKALQIAVQPVAAAQWRGELEKPS